MTLKDQMIMTLRDRCFEGFFYEIKNLFEMLPHGAKVEFREEEAAAYFNSYFNSTKSINGFKVSKKGHIVEKICFGVQEPEPLAEAYRVL